MLAQARVAVEMNDIVDYLGTCELKNKDEMKSLENLKSTSHVIDFLSQCESICR